MKKLICVRDVENARKNGGTVIHICEDTIITPSALDAASDCGITFSTQGDASSTPAAAQCSAPSECGKDGIDSEFIYKALSALMEKGLLPDIASGAGIDLPYVSESDAGKCVKLVRSSTARWEPLDTGNPADKVFYNELIGSDDGSSMNAGFMTIENCTFPWDVACEEIYYVVEGTLTVGCDGRNFVAKPGDCLFFRNGSKLSFGSPDKVKVFYATH